MTSRSSLITRKPSTSSANDVGEDSIQRVVRLSRLNIPQGKLTFVTGLSVHMTQVHKETLTVIENALPNRSGLDVEIFGMEGIPDDVVQAHNQRVLQSFAQAEADRRAATGNAGPGAVGAGQQKKPKFESPSDLKKRLAEHKAKKAAEEATGISSGGDTPGGLGRGSQSPGLGQGPAAYVSCLDLDEISEINNSN